MKKNLRETKFSLPLQSVSDRTMLDRHPLKRKYIGEMAEWSNAAVLKTVDLHGSGGSNPSLSAKHERESASSLLER